MKYHEDKLIGKKFGHLTIIKYLGVRRRESQTSIERTERFVLCECDCEDKTIIERNLHTLIKSANPSCGCTRRKKPESPKPKPLHSNNFKDLTGQKFDMLEVIGYHDTITVGKNNQKIVRYKCRCKCGNVVIIRGMSLRSGNTRSCGCLRFNTDADGNKHVISFHPPETHGKTNTRLYRIYRGIISRCYNPNIKEYKDYGGRGITMDPEWYTPGKRHNTEEFLNFYNWSMANGYHDPLPNQSRKDYLSIDRKDPNGPYAPWNCRWVTQYT